VRAEAVLDLTTGADGGLTAPMPTPCRSLLLHIEQEGEDRIDLGVQISASGDPLHPGDAGLAVELDFWDDLADVYVVPGVRFTLRYPTRVVGRGHVLAVAPL
jgi:hypothetical protein